MEDAEEVHVENENPGNAVRWMSVAVNNIQRNVVFRCRTSLKRCQDANPYCLKFPEFICVDRELEVRATRRPPSSVLGKREWKLHGVICW